MNQQQQPLDDLPEALVTRLRARDERVPMLTPKADRAVREAATAHFADRRTSLPGRRWYIPTAAAAAITLVALIVSRPPDDAMQEQQRFADDTPGLPDDVDGSGRVDILDAFALARSRQANSSDVSQARIDELAARIVSLDLSEFAL